MKEWNNLCLILNDFPLPKFHIIWWRYQSKTVGRCEKFNARVCYGNYVEAIKGKRIIIVPLVQPKKHSLVTCFTPGPLPLTATARHEILHCIGKRFFKGFFLGGGLKRDFLKPFFPLFILFPCRIEKVNFFYYWFLNFLVKCEYENIWVKFIYFKLHFIQVLKNHLAN